MTYNLGIDIGGMSVKGMLLRSDGKVIAEDRIETGARDGGKTLLNNILILSKRLLKNLDGTGSEVAGIGIGCPGLIDSENGAVVFAGNLGLKNFCLAKAITENTGLRVKMTNDANAAALGESKFGAGKKYKNSILITLGTGVGGGIIVDGKLFEGGKSAGAEIGHTVIAYKGLKCTCGRHGCFERYASATALMEQTRAAMEGDRNSAMWQRYTPQTVTGKTPFEYYDTDAAAKSVVDTYIDYLACGIINLANVFRPEVVMLGGGVSEQGEKLTAPLQKILDENLFASTDYAPVKIVKASLGEKAGMYGACALLM